MYRLVTTFESTLIGSSDFVDWKLYSWLYDGNSLKLLVAELLYLVLFRYVGDGNNWLSDVRNHPVNNSDESWAKSTDR